MAGAGKYVGADTSRLPGSRPRLSVECVATHDPPHPIDPVVRAHVGAVVRQLLLPGELDRWDVQWQRDDRSRWMLLAVIDARGERYVGYIKDASTDYPVENGLDTFTDGFEDFISESRFAWGQRRELRDRPWRKRL